MPFKIPDALKSALAAPLLSAGSTVFRPLKKHMFPNCKVGVIGIGGLGHLALQYARNQERKKLLPFSSTFSKKDDAIKLGATDVVSTSDPESLRKWKDELDVVICSASGDELPWGLYTSLLAPEGKLVLVGLVTKPMSLATSSLISKEIQITESLIGSRGEIDEMLEFSSKNNVVPLVEVMKLTDCNIAIHQVFRKYEKAK